MTLRTPQPDLQKKKTIYMAPGSVWPTKRWIETGFEGVARELLHRGHRVILVGSSAEVPLCEEIARKLPNIEILAGRTSLLELVDHFQTGSALVCNDSGAMHAAAVAGLPTVAIFGPTTLNLGFRPWQSRAMVVQTPLPCRPCGAHGGKKCPIKTHECIKDISVLQVLKALQNFLQESILH